MPLRSEPSIGTQMSRAMTRQMVLDHVATAAPVSARTPGCRASNACDADCADCGTDCDAYCQADGGADGSTDQRTDRRAQCNADTCADSWSDGKAYWCADGCAYCSTY